jgi:hypothetical protein
MTPHPSASLRHLRLGSWALAVGLLLGLVLEMLHGFKSGWYLDVGNETRRTMLMLAHTHGTLVALLHIVVGIIVRVCDRPVVSRFASGALIAGLLLPLGFLAGAFGVHGGDPGPGILLAPIGGVALLAGVVSLAVGLSRRS